MKASLNPTYTPSKVEAESGDSETGCLKRYIHIWSQVDCFFLLAVEQWAFNILVGQWEVAQLLSITYVLSESLTKAV